MDMVTYMENHRVGGRSTHPFLNHPRPSISSHCFPAVEHSVPQTITSVLSRTVFGKRLHPTCNCSFSEVEQLHAYLRVFHARPRIDLPSAERGGLHLSFPVVRA